METQVKDQVLFMSSYPPRECGIATYSRDLINAINNNFSRNFDIKVCALEDAGSPQVYPQEVVYRLDIRKSEEYQRLAGEINANDAIKMVFIQHEFGLFGGEYGTYLFRLLSALQKPVSVTFHTVLPRPDEKLLKTVQTLAAYVNSIVAMTKRSARILSEGYAVEANKIVVIPHGTHVVKWKSKAKTKEKYGLNMDKPVLSTFGLLSSNKSIETAIDAIRIIRQKFPDVLYLVLGKTHPGIVRNEGEQYRNQLEKRVRELGLEGNVMFVNRYLNLDELLDYLRLTDIYLFTSKDPHQAVSGTFSYAMSCGCPVISTPIPHAVEMLQNGGGLLVDFNDPEQMAHAAIRLLSDHEWRENMGRRAFQQTRATSWGNVAIPHARLFMALMSKQDELLYNYPEITLKHINELTDNSGIIQFSDLSEPDIESGYTLDDNARALIAMCMYSHHSGNQMIRDRIGVYLNFIEHCQVEGGTFLNYVDKFGIHSQKNHYVNLEDSNGRGLWALGTLISCEDVLPDIDIRKAENIFLKCLPWTDTLMSPRSISFVIKGLYNYNRVRRNNEISEIIDRLARRLTEYCKIARSDDWYWFETQLTYANAVMPEAMLLAYRETGNLKYRTTA